MTTKAFEYGAAAYYSGLSLADCPYNRGERRAAWCQGWMSAASASNEFELCDEWR